MSKVSCLEGWLLEYMQGRLHTGKVCQDETESFNMRVCA